MGLKSAGNQDVLARGQPEAVRDFSEVDERFAPGLGGVVSEEVFVQMFLFVRALRGEGKQGVSLGGLLVWAIWTRFGDRPLSLRHGA